MRSGWRGMSVRINKREPDIGELSARLWASDIEQTWYELSGEGPARESWASQDSHVRCPSRPAQPLSPAVPGAVVVVVVHRPVGAHPEDVEAARAPGGGGR